MRRRKAIVSEVVNFTDHRTFTTRLAGGGQLPPCLSQCNYRPLLKIRGENESFLTPPALHSLRTEDRLSQSAHPGVLLLSPISPTPPASVHLPSPHPGIHTPYQPVRSSDTALASSSHTTTNTTSTSPARRRASAHILASIAHIVSFPVIP